AADSRLQSYNYRLCLTATAANRRAIDAPPGYSEARYELLGRLLDARIAAGNTISITDFMTFASMPNQKSDNNNSGPLSTDDIGANASYVTASYADRAQIAQDHLQYIQGMLYYLGHSTRVPASVRWQMLSYGTCLDEFTDTGGWPSQMYVREARRMIADYVMLQQDCVGSRMADDSVGLGSYTIDSHIEQRFVKNGYAWNEGVLGRNVFEPYRISYRSIVPRAGECENLLVPCALSASHVAFGSVRMEPVFMNLSQSAATAAAFSIDGNSTVQQVDYAKLALELNADGQALTWASAEALGVVVDTEDAAGVTITGTWSPSTSIDGYLGNNYLHDGNTAKGTRSIRFTPTILASGAYDIYLRWTSATNRATNVPVDVTSASGTTTFIVNERNNGGIWFKLTTAGPVTLAAGNAASVLVRTTGTDGYVAADSVRFAPYTPPAATVQIVASDPISREATPSDHARFTVVRPSDQTASDWTVSYSISGTATPGADYVALPGSVTIPAGQVAATIDVAPIPDDLVEGDETVTLTLLPGASFSVGALASATATIIDKPRVQIVATDPTASEADVTDTAQFTVFRDASQTAGAWTVSYSVSGTATAGADYVALPGSVTIPAGQTSATIAVTAIADDIIESDETVTLTLLPDAAFTPGASSSATITIMDKPTVQIVATTPSTSEASVSQPALFTVSRDASQTASDWTVSYQVSGTAIASLHFVALPGGVTIPAGQTSATIALTPIADDIAEGDRTVTLTLLSGASFTAGANASATATIHDKPIDTWRLAIFTAAQLVDPSISGDNADPDHDGFKNLTEYALGLNPLAQEPAATTTAWDATGRLTLTYNARRSATDITIIAEGSTDLQNWSAGPEMVEEVARVAQGDFDVVTVRLAPVSPPSGFLRVRVTRP
ncbi:MAG TPA: FAD-dependent oxidoreductase, partial [Chthoniobacteraceae bacterium]|nr:FAD-dependent oxidoreductase [Chthoniobacteraceae bacterium]